MKKKILVAIACVSLCFQTACASGAELNLEGVFNSFAKRIIAVLQQKESENEEVLKDDIRSVEEFVTVVGVRQAVLESGAEVYEIEYAKNGKIAKSVLVADEDCVVSGAKSSIESLECGDLIIIDKVYDDIVDYIVVVMSLENIEMDFTSFDSRIFVPNRAAWYKYGEKSNAKHEVYFGYILNAEISGGRVKLLMNNGDGKMDSSQFFTIGENTDVLAYNAYAKSAENKFEKCDIYSIIPSVYPKTDTSDVDFSSEQFELSEMKCALIYINHGEIVNITLVNYTK